VKQTLIRYAKRYDVIFSFGGTFISSVFVYADKLPIYAIIAVILIRELCGFMAMLAKEREEV
jgi:hypothetical protein